MMKKFWIFLAVTVLLMTVIPCLTVALIRSNAGFAVCLLLFFAVNPLYCLVSGVISAKEPRRRAFWPLIPPIVYLLSCWALFEYAEKAFLLYAGIYAVLGYAAMLVTLLIRKIRK